MILKCRKSNRESQFYIPGTYTVLLALLLCVVITVFHFVSTVSHQSTIITLFVRCCTTYEHVFVYTCLLLCSVLLYCCCCCCCCLSSCAGWQKLLLWFTVPGCSDLFLFIDTIYFQCTPWQYCLIYSVNFLPIIHAWYHTSSILRACEEPRRALGRRGASLRGRLPPATLPHKEII